MAPGGWATADQSLHLRTDIAKYCKFADMGKFERFWAEMEASWFTKWPVEDALKLLCVNTPEGGQLTGEQLVVIGVATKKRKGVHFEPADVLRTDLTCPTATEVLLSLRAHEAALGVQEDFPGVDGGAVVPQKSPPEPQAPSHRDLPEKQQRANHADAA
jgi:hypothetical protein